MQTHTRRDFLKTAGKLAALFGVGAGAVPRMASAMDDIYQGKAPVLWLQGLNCSGCSVSLLNGELIQPLALLTKYISLKFHQSLSTTQGQQASTTVNETIARGDYVLVVEGAVPLGIPDACTFAGEDFKDLLDRAARAASSVVAVGACSSFGGIPSAPPNPTGAVGVRDFFSDQGITKHLINVPGCPPHPDWMIGTIVHVLTNGIPALDEELRPMAFFSERIHRRCPLRKFDDEANEIGAKGCMENIGCRGTSTFGDCPVRGWNGIQTNCISSRGMCIGCTSPNFAKDGSFYQESTEE